MEKKKIKPRWDNIFKAFCGVFMIVTAIIAVIIFTPIEAKPPEETTTIKKGQAPEIEEQAKESCVMYYDVSLDYDLQNHIFQLCANYNIEPEIVIAIIAVESSFDDKAVSSDNAIGLMQIQPKWHKDRIERLNCYNLFDPYMNITVGVDYLAELKEVNPNINFMLAAYNGGIEYANSQAASGYYTEYVQNVLKISTDLELKGVAADVLL